RSHPQTSTQHDDMDIIHSTLPPSISAKYSLRSYIALTTSQSVPLSNYTGVQISYLQIDNYRESAIHNSSLVDVSIHISHSQPFGFRQSNLDSVHAVVKIAV